MTMLNNEDSLEARPGWVAHVSNYNNFTKFMSKFIIVKQCVAPNNNQCWAPNEAAGTFWDNPFIGASARCFIDNSGRAWCEVNGNRGYLILDTNGFKPPNQFGKDRFPLDFSVDSNCTAFGACNTPGIPKTVYPFGDQGVSANLCPAGNCYYKSWLTN